MRQHDRAFVRAHRRRRTTLLPALASLALLLGVVRTASAHAHLLSASPKAGSTLHESPTRIRMVFSEALERTMSRVLLVGPVGRETVLVAVGEPGDARVAASASTDSASAVAPRAGDRGSAEPPVARPDSLPVQSPMRAPMSAPTRVSSAPWSGSIAGAPALPALLRGLSDGVLLASLGVLLFLVTSGSAAPHTSGVNAADSSAEPGAAALVRALAILTAALLALCALATLQVARRPSLALGFTLLAVLASGASGHAAPIDSLVAIPSKLVHLLGVAVWLGGLLWLVVMLREPAARSRREANRVSTLALVAVILVALSGVVQALLFVPDVATLMHTPYGALVLAKVAGLVPLAAFGADHRQRVLPSLRASERTPRFGSSLRTEIGVMCVVLLVGGVLAYVSPASETSSPDVPEVAGPLELPR